MTTLNVVTDEMIQQHEKLVHKVINSELASLHVYERVHGLSYDDLFQIGCIGLYTALQRFDSTKNIQFSTYAYKCIHGEIMNSVRGSYYGTKVRTKIATAISSYVKEVKASKTCDTIVLQQKYNLTDDDLTEVIELASKRFVSGDRPLKNDSKSRTLFSLCTQHTQDNNIDKMIQSEELEEMLEVVSPIQRQVLELYLKDLSSIEIAERLGKTLSNVTSLIGAGFKNIRKYYTYGDYSI